MKAATITAFLGLLASVVAAVADGPVVERRMAVTFDDLPAQRAQALPGVRVQAISTDLIELLVSEQVPAIGFVNEDKLYVDGVLDPTRVELLERWLEAGLELGNHTFSHPDLHRVSFDEFRRDVIRGEQVIRPLSDSRGGELRFFRHPFLHTGRDLETKLALEDFLTRRGYRVAPVTIDNSEWIFARAFDEALDRADTELQKRLSAAYVDYMEAMVVYYEGQSRALFDREIPQILLLHANALNGRNLPTLIERLRARGYEFVSLDAALADPAYRSDDTYVGPGGITWLHRWAITRDVDRSIFAGEPTTPDWVQDVAGIRE